MHKCVPQERTPWAPEFEERTPDETLKQERCGRGAAWELAKYVCTHKKERNDTFYYFPAEASDVDKSRRARIRNRLQNVYAPAEQKGSKLR